MQTITAMFTNPNVLCINYNTNTVSENINII